MVPAGWDTQQKISILNDTLRSFNLEDNLTTVCDVIDVIALLSYYCMLESVSIVEIHVLCMYYMTVKNWIKARQPR